MTNIPPYQQQAREREARYARRDASPIPLNEQERAERRHHSIVGFWRQVLFWGPTAFAVALQLIFGGYWVAVIVIFMMRSAALVVGGLTLRVLDQFLTIGQGGWVAFNTVISTIAAGFGVVLTYQGIANSGGPMSEVWLAAAGGLVLAIWPMLYSALRSANPTDYERMVWAAQASRPSRIIE
jgi:hypothetical protein